MAEGPKKILIAEDDKAMARALNLKLTNAGFIVTSVYDGQEALDVLNKEIFDLVITDLVMPKIDGFGILKGIHDKGLKIPVIVTSNLSQNEDETKAKQAGATEYLIKSNTPIVKIVEHVQKALS
ncbi:hypothetical protein A3I18_00710 [Candidatus Campbellbacteria bacterium RIFCSPLOWO2_02_FULL_35_11]|uniref:Response regulatory domain-containing protein n=2 Tax=Candidatus Campbelliibacteriota TaxID=1752727 RepID=A0A1F5ENR2_9BACT|nr:MAG: hypothetical protein A3E89_01260 [Candidatus Campbellbacteria bacterium RIFCSPHIGHO2_12_FULL_35_10]OGD69904.1 MAG: hypothetical protein A3I18_00710 [Candidatus Campbellbacteria bacterium RIFCSPLOWO2_02_FULL_35_11]